MTREEALALKERVEILIEEARSSREIYDFGAVNWGDIGVVDIVKEESLLYPDYPGVPEYVVTIEEASPESALASWLTLQLDEPTVYVQAEW